MSEFASEVLGDMLAALHDVEQTVIKLMDTRGDDVEDDDLFILLDQMDRIRDRFKYAQEAVASMVAYRMVDDVVVIPGAVFERKAGSTRKSWNHAALKSVAAERIVERAIDPETGAIMVPPSQLLADAFEVAGIQYWKVRALRGLGIKAANYCEETTGDPKIVIRRAGSSPPAESDEE